VEVIIPTRDRGDLLDCCLTSLALTHYPRFDITIVDNGSTEAEALAHQRGRHVLHHPGSFNFSDLVNDAVFASKAAYVVLLNNDIEIIDPEWLDVLMDEALGTGVAAVGCRLVDGDGTANHEGIALGVAGAIAIELSLHGLDAMRSAARDVAAVTAACMVVNVDAFRTVGGFDPLFAVGYGDVDFCLRLRRAGYAIIYTPEATVRHLGRATRADAAHPDDDQMFVARWGRGGLVAPDPFVNPLIVGFDPPVLAVSLQDRLSARAPSKPGQAVQGVDHSDHGQSVGDR
jgi:GT2 family glycosyltransferase